MDAVDTLSSSTGTRSTGQSGFSDLSSEDFTKIMFAELTRQDPLQPNDTNALLQQISSIRSIESNSALSNELTRLVSQNEFASASTLIGKSVSGLTDQAQRVEGVVATVGRTDEGAVVTLKSGERIALENLDEVKEAGTDA